MPDRLEFFVELAPISKGNSKEIAYAGRRRFIRSKPHVVRAERSLRLLALQHRPPRPWGGPVRLDVTFVLPIARSWPKWRQKAARAGELLPTSVPDRGNLLKLAEDALAGAFYVNDAQVVAGEVAKIYGDIPGYRFTLTAIAVPRARPAAELVE